MNETVSQTEFMHASLFQFFAEGVDPFLRVKATADNSYGWAHRPGDPEGGIPAWDLTQGVPANVYTHPHYYSDMSEPSNREAHNILRRIRNNPETKIRIYRSLPAEKAHHGIKPGDWVSISKEYARQHGKQEDPKNDWPVIRATVKAKDLFTDADDFREFGFWGEKPSWHHISFKGGKNQEVSARSDGSVRAVKRRNQAQASVVDFFYQAADNDLFQFFAEGVDPFLRAKANAEFELDRANKKHDAVIEEAERPLKSARNAARAEYDAVFEKQRPIKFEIDQKLSVHRGVWWDSIEKANKEFAPHEDRIMGLINEAFEKYKPHTIKTEELKNERIDEENKHKSKIRNAGAAFGPHSEKFSRSLRHADQTFSIDSPEHKKAVADAMEAIRPHKEILDQAKSNADKNLDDYLVKHNKAMDEANAELEPHKQAYNARQEALLAELQPHRDKRDAAYAAAENVFDPHAKKYDIAMKKANDSLDEARKIANDKIGDAEDEHENSGRAEIVRREKRKRFATLSRFSTQMQNAPDPQNVEYKFHSYSEHGGKQLHAVTAHHNGEQVGHIRWANDQIQTHRKLFPGEIGYVGVIPVYERHGIATNLVKKAREFYESGEASTRAEHSDDKTDQGRAWHQRMVEKDPRMASLLQYFASYEDSFLKIKKQEDAKLNSARRGSDEEFSNAYKIYIQNMRKAPHPMNVEYEFNKRSEHGGNQMHQVTAYHNGEEVGHVRWANDEKKTRHSLFPGEIGHIQVTPEYQRHGIATNLIKKAREFYEFGDASTRIEHSDHKTTQGQAWYDRMVEKNPTLASLLQHFASDEDPFLTIKKQEKAKLNAAKRGSNEEFSNAYKIYIQNMRKAPHPMNVEYKFYRAVGTVGSMHEVTANHDGKQVGNLRWATDTHDKYSSGYFSGEISNIDVDDEYQRHGIATKMMEKARDAHYSGRAITKPQHSDILSDDGEAWVSSLPPSLSLLQHFASDEDPFLTIKKQEDARLQNAINKHENEYYKSKSEDAFLDFQKNLDEANKTYTQNMSNAPHPQNIEYRFKESPEKGGSHRITVHHNNEQIGVLSWTDRHGDDLSKLSPGEIDWIEVDPGYQYHGIATTMLTKAHEAHMLGLADTKPIHSNRKTSEGRAWHDHLVKTLHPHASKNANERNAVLDSWRPNQRLFAPTIGSLDPRLFEDDKIRPEIRESIINRIAELWDSQYKEWKNWSKVYIAGSSVSQWWADPSAVKNPEIGASQGYHLNDDLDTLIGIEYGGLIESNPQFATMSPEKISAHMNAELREHCNIEEAYFNVPFIGIPEWEWNGEPFGGKIKVGPWSATFYVNPHSYDISVLKPYAAYNLTDDEWAVRPIEAPEGHQFNQSEWYYFEGLAVEIENILKLPEPSRNRRARQLWEFIHESRKGAFKPSGRGVFDYRNAAEKYLDQKGLWQPLVNARFGIDKKEGAQ